VITRQPRKRRKPNALQGVGLFAGRLGRPFRRLTFAPQRRNLVAIDTNPDWHPHTSRLIFERLRHCVRGLRCPMDHWVAGDVFLWDGSRVRRLTCGGYSGEPSFSPDGASFVYLSGRVICVRALGARRDSWCGAPDGLSPSWQPVTPATKYR
jgi:hypothetical protein